MALIPPMAAGLVKVRASVPPKELGTVVVTQSNSFKYYTVFNSFDPEFWEKADED